MASFSGMGGTPKKEQGGARPLPPATEEQKQRLADQKAWLEAQGGFSGLSETLAAGGQVTPWAPGWQRTLQQQGIVNEDPE